MVSVYPTREIREMRIGGRSLMQVIATNMKTYCRKQIEKSYADDLLIDSTWMVIAISGETLRGFAFLTKDNNHTLSLPLICAAVAHPMCRRSALKDNVGGDMLRFIKNFCIERGFARIRLHALAPVISLYHKFGWRFVHRCNHREKKDITEAVAAFSHDLDFIRKGVGGPDSAAPRMMEFIVQCNKDKGSAWWNLRELLERNDFSVTTNRFGHTLYTQKRLAALGAEDASIDYGVGMNLRDKLLGYYEAEDEGIEFTGELVRRDPQDEGYKMLWSVKW